MDNTFNQCVNWHFAADVTKDLFTLGRKLKTTKEIIPFKVSLVNQQVYWNCFQEDRWLKGSCIQQVLYRVGAGVGQHKTQLWSCVVVEPVSPGCWGQHLCWGSGVSSPTCKPSGSVTLASGECWEPFLQPQGASSLDVVPSRSQLS